MIERARRSVVQVRSGERGVGAGVIWDAEEGLVLTNEHVVSGGRREGGLQVALRDGRTFDARVARSEPRLDLALLSLDFDGPVDLPAAPVGDSGALRVGELVFAIGHPWGNPGAATAGIVGAIEAPRSLRGSRASRGPRRGWRTRYIRSDVSLAPGNSGGPLLNARGEVVGINAMISGGEALSIPSNTASAWAARDRRPRLGVSVVPAGIPGTGGDGLVVAGVEVGSPAERSGLMVGDVLLGTEEEPLADARLIVDALLGAGTRLRVMRGGETLLVEVDLKAAGPGRAA